MQAFESYKLGHSLIDSQHELLFGLIADLESKIQDDRGRSVLADLLERLYSYAALHFDTEDRLMTETAYPDTANHRAEHERVLAGVKRLDGAYRSGVPSAPEDALRFMQAWATEHIPTADRRLLEHLRSAAGPTKAAPAARKAPGTPDQSGT